MAGDGGKTRRTIGMLVGRIPGELGRCNSRGVDADQSIAGLKDGLRGVFIEEIFGASAGMQSNGFMRVSGIRFFIPDALEAAGMRGWGWCADFVTAVTARDFT